jgi:hypothetical protein
MNFHSFNCRSTDVKSQELPWSAYAHVTVAACNQLARAYAIDTLKGDFQSGFYGEEVFEAVAERNARDTDGSTLIRSTRKEALSRFSDRSIDLLRIDRAHSIWI